jgi:protein O-GlcNAc transferase
MMLSIVKDNCISEINIEHAVVLHQAGRIDEACRIYECILDVDPTNADALHLLGLVFYGRGETERAVCLIRSAIEEKPDISNFYRNLGAVLEAQGKQEEALAAYDQAVRIDPYCAGAHYGRGNMMTRLTRLADACEAYRQAIEIAPDYAEAHNSLGVALEQQGFLPDALAAYDRAVEIDCAHPGAHNNRGSVLVKLGRVSEGISAYEAAINIDTNFELAHLNRARALRTCGRNAEALAGYRQALAIRRDLPEVHFEHATLLAEVGRHNDALAAYDELLILDPHSAAAHNNRGTILRDQGHVDEALAAFRQALRCDPRFPAAHLNQGNIYMQMGRLDHALAAYDCALLNDPEFAAAHFGRGNLFREQGKLDDAIVAYNRAVTCDPNLCDANNNLGVVLLSLGRVGEALAAFGRAISVDPDHAAAHANRANALTDRGQFTEATLSFEAALRLDPGLRENHSNYLNCLNYDPTRSDAELLEAHRHWGERHGNPAALARVHDNDQDPGRPLRIGFVSADLGRHPVGYLVQPLMEAADPDAIRFYCYSGRPVEDDLSDRLRAQAQTWRQTLPLSDGELAAAIEADRIDILIDLAGHTASNRLGCFALRPAPVQVHWAGYAYTTGLPAVDYALWDAVHVPEGADRWFTETVVRLPVRWCYAPPEYAPDVAAPPVMTSGHVTLGSFNNLTKLVPEVVDAWSQILAVLPDARLLLSWRTLVDTEQRARIHALFAAHGIEPKRIELSQGAATHAGVLGQYGRVDIALDPFPYSGGLTTLEALWMGVPVVTLPASRPVSRQSASLLSALGRNEWIAKDRDDYVRLVLDLAADPRRLADLRRDQRPRMAASPLCDAPRFARSFEAAVREMWLTWCQSAPRRAG